MDTFKLTGTGGEPHAQDNAISFQAGKGDYIIIPITPLEGEVCLSTTYVYYKDEPLAVINASYVEYLGKEVIYFNNKYKKEFKFKLKSEKLHFS
tara:strand:- start:156 stop:437 length:282 start_codon:yes stop_codon:yes gene_type:complete